MSHGIHKTHTRQRQELGTAAAAETVATATTMVLQQQRFFITVMSHEHHRVSYHWQLNCMFKSLFGLATKENESFTLLPLCEGNSSVTSGFL